MQRLLILSHVELTRDPRPRRQIAAARARGLDVVGICPVFPNETPLEVSARVVRVRAERLAPRLRRAGMGGITPSSRSSVRELRGLFRLWRLLRTTVMLARAGLRERPIDTVLANEIETLPAGWIVARLARARLIYDAHEIYASSEPDQPVLHRSMTAWLERVLARRADRVITVSDAIAEELQRRLRLVERPMAVLNAPERRDVGVVARQGPMRVVYQGAMAASRPIEDLLDAAEIAGDAVHVTVRVVNADLGVLREEVRRRGLQERVDIADPVSPAELVEALDGEDVGVILNRPLSLNDELVFPNKLFEYMMAGLAVVAPRLPGLTPLFENEQIGATYRPADSTSLGHVLKELAGDHTRLLELRQRARALAMERYNAETEAERLADVLDPSRSFA